jgi:hypothetical protein
MGDAKSHPSLPLDLGIDSCISVLDHNAILILTYWPAPGPGSAPRPVVLSFEVDKRQCCSGLLLEDKSCRSTVQGHGTGPRKRRHTCQGLGGRWAAWWRRRDVQNGNPELWIYNEIARRPSVPTEPVVSGSADSGAVRSWSSWPGRCPCGFPQAARPDVA